MDGVLKKDESYAERRQLFKHIWETAMHLDTADVFAKPKVIRTLRLDDVDKSMGRKKKQRIKNLRLVCKKILDFCDRQDAEDMLYQKILTEGKDNNNKQLVLKKKSPVKIRKPCSSLSPVPVSPVRSPKKISQHNKDGVKISEQNITRSPSPTKFQLKKNVTSNNAVKNNTYNKTPFTISNIRTLVPSIPKREVKLKKRKHKHRRKKIKETTNVPAAAPIVQA